MCKMAVSYIRTVLSFSVLCLQFYSEPEGIEAAAKNNENRVNKKKY